MTAVVDLVVDARPVLHPTAGGRGIGNYVRGLLDGLAEADVAFSAVVDDPDAARILTSAVGVERVWSWGDVRRSVDASTWFVATGAYLHPISFDPIPRTITAAGMPIALVMYDVIPQRHPELYLDNERIVRLVELRRPLVRTAELVVAISSFSARTAIDHLALDPTRVATIGAGYGASFRPPPPGGQRRDVVAVTGPDPRKNTDRLIEAWCLIDPRVVRHRVLRIVAGAPASVQSRWRSLADRSRRGSSIELVGAVDDATLVTMLQQAELAVQPSIEEGFGMPVVEAAACGTPVVCSNVSALPEVLDEPRGDVRSLRRLGHGPRHRAGSRRFDVPPPARRGGPARRRALDLASSRHRPHDGDSVGTDAPAAPAPAPARRARGRVGTRRPRRRRRGPRAHVWRRRRGVRR